MRNARKWSLSSKIFGEISRLRSSQSGLIAFNVGSSLGEFRVMEFVVARHEQNLAVRILPAYLFGCFDDRLLDHSPLVGDATLSGHRVEAD